MSRKPIINKVARTASPPVLFSTEDAQRMNNDLNILTQKLTEVQQKFSVGSASGVSPFVANLRETASSFSPENGAIDSKLSLLEKIITKIIEVDRVVLRNTEATDDNSNRRRSNKTPDLFSMPTHLHVVDRLLDVHTRNQRVAVIRESSPAPIPPHSEHNPADLTKIEELEASVAELNDALKESLARESDLVKKQDALLKKQDDFERQIGAVALDKVLSDKKMEEDYEIALEKMKSSILVYRNNTEMLEERLEKEMANRQAIINALLTMSKNVKESRDSQHYLPESEINLLVRTLCIEFDEFRYVYSCFFYCSRKIVNLDLKCCKQA